MFSEAEYIYTEIIKDLETRFNISLSEKKKLKKYWINEKIIKWKTNAELASLRSKSYSYFIDDGDANKKPTGTIKVIKLKIKFEGKKNV